MNFNSIQPSGELNAIFRKLRLRPRLTQFHDNRGGETKANGTVRYDLTE